MQETFGIELLQFSLERINFGTKSNFLTSFLTKVLKKNGNEVNKLEKENEDLVTRVKILEKELNSNKEEINQKVSLLTLKNIKLFAQNSSLKRNLLDVKKLTENDQAKGNEKIKKLQQAMNELRNKNRELQQTLKKGGIVRRGTSKEDLEAIKKEKGIIRDLAQQKNQIENKLNQTDREMKRFKLKYEDALTRLKQKESHLKFICDEFIASTSISNVFN